MEIDPSEPKPLSQENCIYETYIPQDSQIIKRTFLPAQDELLSLCDKTLQQKLRR